MKEPAVLLADEPTGNLDEGTRDEIIVLLEKLWRELGLTFILVTHDSTVARRAQRTRADAGRPPVRPAGNPSSGGALREVRRTGSATEVHSFLATSGPVMRASSGKVAAMMPRDTAIPPAVSR